LFAFFALRKARQIGDPGFAELGGEDLRETGVALAKPASRRDAVRLVAELLRPQLREIAEQAILQDPAMELRDSVDVLASDDREVGHPDLLLRPLGDERHSAHARLVRRESRAYLVEEAPVDLVDDLEVARQDVTEHGDGPLLERLRQHGVIRVSEGLGGDRPRVVPAEALLVEEETHQLGDGDGGVRVVQLEDRGFVQVLHAREERQVATDRVLEGGGNEEELLTQP
jgi:hypothetical protein